MSAMTAQQEYCRKDIITNRLELNDSLIKERRIVLEKFTNEWGSEYNANNREVSAIITVPVVVHVLYKTEATNISDAHNSQFIALNKYFRGIDEHFDAKTPAVFKPLKADSEIEFCLAKKDANGNASTGIIRKQVAANFNLENDYYDPTKGSVALDTSKYLNIWVVDYGTSGTSGTNGSATDPASGQ